MSPFVTYMLIVALVVGVIAMNISVFRDQRSKGQGTMLAFTNPKLYLWFFSLVAILFLVILLNV